MTSPVKKVSFKLPSKPTQNCASRAQADIWSEKKASYLSKQSESGSQRRPCYRSETPKLKGLRFSYFTFFQIVATKKDQN